MTTEDQQNFQKVLSNRELALAKQLAQQAARNLQPGSAPTPTSIPTPRQVSPIPLPLPLRPTPSLTSSLTMQQSFDKQQQLQTSNAAAAKHGMINSQSKLFAGINNANFQNYPPTSTSQHLRSRLSPSNSPSPSVIPPRSQPYCSAPSMSAIHQQMLNADAYSVANRLGGVGLRHSRSESNPSPQMRMNGSPIPKKQEDTRNGHSQKMVHTYATGKSSPAGMRPLPPTGSKPPMYPSGVNSVVGGAQVPPLATPALRSVSSMNGSLSARSQPRRSSVGSPNPGLMQGEENRMARGSLTSRHTRNNSTPSQVDAEYTAMLLQQRQVLQQQMGGGNSGMDSMQQQILSTQIAIQKDLQHKQLMQDLIIQNSLNASAAEVLGRLAGNDLPPQSSSLQHRAPLQQPQLSLPTPAPQSHPFVPPKLELYAQLLGGSEVAEANLASIPELEAQLFSAVADCLYVLMMGESVEEVLTNIMAIAQFTKSEQSQIQVPMPRAFASQLRRVALIMPLITAVYQDRNEKLTVREGYATLLRIFAEPYPLLSDQLESLMGMGEAAAACVLDSSNLWRQVIALLQDKQVKLHNMEVQPLTITT